MDIHYLCEIEINFLFFGLSSLLTRSNVMWTINPEEMVVAPQYTISVS